MTQQFKQYVITISIISVSLWCVSVGTYLLAPLTLVRLLPTMDTLVSLKVVALDKPHITHVTSKWLLSYKAHKYTVNAYIFAFCNN